MRIHDLHTIDSRYERIFISPHLDDAALSCGGALVQAPSLVVTICTGAPGADRPMSGLAREIHAEWGLAPEEAVTARLQEDARAMETLAADYYWAGLLDAIYRVPEAYDSRDRLFGDPQPGDPLGPALRRLLEALAGCAPRAQFYAPLGVGRHVDHLLTHAAARETLPPGRLWFYEDIPYVISDPRGLERRLAKLGGRWEPQTVEIGRSLERKLDAIAAYASQMEALFGGPAAMRERVADYAASVGPGGAERLWRPAISGERR